MKWDDMEKKLKKHSIHKMNDNFSDWFKKYQLNRFIHNSFNNISELGYHIVFANNRQESVHRAIKEFIHCSCTVIDFMNKFEQYVISQQKERIRVYNYLGDFEVTDHLKTSKSEIDDERMINKFLTLTSIDIQKYTSSQNKVTLQKSKEASNKNQHLLAKSVAQTTLTEKSKIPVNAGKK